MNQKKLKKSQKKNECVVKPWLQILYSEGWKQYCHEDNLGTTRNNMFIGINGFLIALMVGSLNPLTEVMGKGLLKIDTSLCSGIIFSFFGILGFKIAKIWKKLALAGQQYYNMRRTMLRLIEKKACLSSVNLAEKEDQWRKHSKEHPTQSFSLDNNEEFTIAPYCHHGGWISTSNIASVIKFLWLAIYCIGIFLMGNYLYFSIY